MSLAEPLPKYLQSMIICFQSFVDYLIYVDFYKHAFYQKSGRDAQRELLKLRYWLERCDRRPATNYLFACTSGGEAITRFSRLGVTKLPITAYSGQTGSRWAGRRSEKKVDVETTRQGASPTTHVADRVHFRPLTGTPLDDSTWCSAVNHQLRANIDLCPGLLLLLRPPRSSLTKITHPLLHRRYAVVLPVDCLVLHLRPSPIFQRMSVYWASLMCTMPDRRRWQRFTQTHLSSASLSSSCIV